MICDPGMRLRRLIERHVQLVDTYSLYADQGRNTEGVEEAIEYHRNEVRQIAKDVPLVQSDEPRLYRVCPFARYAHTPDPVKYAQVAVECILLDLKAHKLKHMVRDTAEGFEIYCWLNDFYLDVLSFKPGIGLTKIVKTMVLAGVDPRVYYPFLKAEQCGI